MLTVKVSRMRSPKIEFKRLLILNLRGSVMHPANQTVRLRIARRFSNCSFSNRFGVNFPRDQSPFDEYFNDNDLRADFYEGVRCGLLHEVRSKMVGK